MQVPVTSAVKERWGSTVCRAHSDMSCICLAFKPRNHKVSVGCFRIHHCVVWVKGGTSVFLWGHLLRGSCFQELYLCAPPPSSLGFSGSGEGVRQVQVCICFMWYTVLDDVCKESLYPNHLLSALMKCSETVLLQGWSHSLRECLEVFFISCGSTKQTVQQSVHLPGTWSLGRRARS